MFCETSLAAMLDMAAFAAEDSELRVPNVGLHGAKFMLVGRLSTRVHELANTAVASPFVVVLS